MDWNFWKRAWEEGWTPFHREEVQVPLKEYFVRLSLPEGSRVLVPLCGKSRDMEWLAQQGMKVCGVELSELAIEQFFTESGRTFKQTQEGGFDVYQSGPIELWKGDFFNFPTEQMQSFALVYDRASLVALSQPNRQRYAQKMRDELQEGCQYLLVSFRYQLSREGEEVGPPFSVEEVELERLFGAFQSFQKLSGETGLEGPQHIKDRGGHGFESRVFWGRR